MSANKSSKSKMAFTLADHLVPRDSFGRGRQKRRRVGEEKEEGLLKTVDCFFKNW